jgi:glycosyltransferase involved in cell wall biosynthesis
MAPASQSDTKKLRILHCFRSPVGGIFRHVRDLIHQQVEQGHCVGVICDSNTGGAYEEQLLSDLENHLELGLFRIPMDRSIGPRDLVVLYKLYGQIRDIEADVLHSHGAKGGAYARLIGSLLRRGSRRRPVRLYCPHGGSVHYDQHKLSGRLYFGLERFLERFTDRLIFVSAYERDSYFAKVGEAHCPHSLVRNGLNGDEFEPVEINKDATDFLYVGMMRDLKGVDLFLEALPQVAQRLNRPISATLVGDGPDLPTYKAQAAGLGDNVNVTFHNPMPVRQAFALGETLVVPSRAESMPYIVLEALAARRPVLATRVGGIPEIFAENAGALIEPDNVDALANSLSGYISGTVKAPDFLQMHQSIEENFSAKAMTGTIMQAYQAALKA